MLTIAPLLRLGLTYLPKALAAATARERFQTVPSDLPGIFTIGTFECRLDNDDRVDFQACAPRSGGAHAVVRRWLQGPESKAPSSPRHRSTSALLRHWIDASSDLGGDIAAIWVEIDVDAGIEAPRPFPFFTLTPPWMRSGPRPPERTKTLVDAGLDVLTQGNLDRETRGMVHTCLRELPPQASLFHVAMRPMPGGDVVRLIAGTPWSLVPGFLERLEWPEPVDHLRRFLKRYCEDTVINSIQLDVAGRLGPRLGVEFYWPTAPHRDPRWTSLFDKLLIDGACTPFRREQVYAWPGHDPVDNGEHIARELLVKVVYEVGKPPRAKAYLPYGLIRNVQQAAVFEDRQKATPAGA